MDLVDRYLQAVKFWLPRAQKQDIVAELAEDIRSQIAHKEAELGRAVAPAEVEVILRQIGRPVLVANRYLPQRHLIGPLWFPVYELVLKIVVACYLVPWILVWLGLVIFTPSYRAAHLGGGWLEALGTAWGSFWIAALTAVGTVTIVFALLERAHANTGLLENWDPAKLPAVKDPSRIARGSSVVELVANIVFSSWWVTAMSSPVVFDRPHVRITLTPAWRYYFLGFLILALTNVATAGVNLLKPYWTRPRAVVRLLSNVAGSVLFCGLFLFPILAEISVPGVASETTLRVTKTVNRMMGQSFPIVFAIGLIVLAVDIRRVMRVNAPREFALGGVAENGQKP